MTGTPEAPRIRRETIEECANAIAARRRLLHSQFEAINISSEDAIYDICEKLVCALADAGDGWQNISTAPQTYVPTLSPINHHAPRIIVTDHIFYEVVAWGGPSRPFWVDAHGRKLFFTPTHWRPLPPPPSDQKGE